MFQYLCPLNMHGFVEIFDKKEKRKKNNPFSPHLSHQKVEENFVEVPTESSLQYRRFQEKKEKEY